VIYTNLLDVNLLGGGQNDRSNNSSTEHNLLDNNGSEIALDIQGDLHGNSGSNIRRAWGGSQEHEPHYRRIEDNL